MFLPRKKLLGQTNQAGCSPWGHKESDVTKQLSMHTYLQQNAKTWVLQNHIWVHSPECSKAKLLTLGRDKEKHDAYYRAPGKESGQLVLERPEHPDGVLKDRVRYVISLWTFLLTGWWWRWIRSQHHQFWLQLVWSLHACGYNTANFFCLAGGGGSISVKELQRTQLRILSKVVDFNYYYFVLLDCFLFFFSSAFFFFFCFSIKCILWNSEKT